MLDLNSSFIISEVRGLCVNRIKDQMWRKTTTSLPADDS